MFKRHGNRVIDYSHYFEISAEKPVQDYDIDLWFFIPSNLNQSNYTTDDFFKDFLSYTRYSAPNLTLNSLIDFHNDKNPLARLKNSSHSPKCYSRVEYELKTLLNTLKMSSLQTITTLKAMKLYSKYEAERNLKIQCGRFTEILDTLVDIYNNTPADYHSIYLLALEGVSLRIENTLYKIYDDFKESRKLIVDEIRKQRAFRKSMNFISIASDNDKQNNELIYREHLIKKWSESIMYINLEKSKTQKGLSHVFLGSAAAIAMLFAGIITLVFAKWVGQESVIWFLIALLAYSLKDRIKDVLKSIFIKRMRNLFSDRVKDVVTPIRKRKCGKSKERVSFPDFTEIEKKVQDLRFSYKDDLSIKQYQEDIIHYNKSVSIKTPILYKNHTRLFGIKEIMRFDFRRWFHKMDRRTEKCFIPENDVLKQVKGEREYHFTVIIRVRSNKESTLERFRVVANNQKIRSVVKVS